MRTTRYLLAVTVALAVSATAAAQFVSPGAPLPQQGGRISSVPTTPAYSPVPAAYASPQASYPGYGYGGNTYIESPIGSYYNGLANLTTAYGQYAQDYQKARLLNQEAERSKIQTRQMINDQLRYEEMMRPKADDVAAQRKAQDLRRALNDPPITEILTANALNTLLKNAQKYQGQGAYAPPLPLDPDTLRNIHLASSAGTNVALFKDGGKLKFPYVLRDPAFEKERTTIQDLTYKSLQEAQGGASDIGTVRELTKAADELEKTISRKGPEMEMADAIQANRFVNELRDGIRALQRPDAAASLKSSTPPAVRSVGDLVAYMTRTGLTFAPATTGDEAAYRSLHQSLVSFNNGVMQQARR